MEPDRQVRLLQFPRPRERTCTSFAAKTLACPRANLFRGIVKSAINQTASGSAALASFATIACSSVAGKQSRKKCVTKRSYDFRGDHCRMSSQIKWTRETDSGCVRLRRARARWSMASLASIQSTSIFGCARTSSQRKRPSPSPRISVRFGRAIVSIQRVRARCNALPKAIASSQR